jgi:squalene synthase HpnC
MPVDHYENFPVASWLLPATLRRPVEAIYVFARAADDFADEGERTNAERLAALEGFRNELRRIEQGGTPQGSVLGNLARVIREHELPLQPFHDLLDAFSQDVTKRRYDDFGEVMDYCRRSANPIGRLLLHLYGAATPRNFALSDGICASLQLINFLQDIPIDYRKGRIYLPQDEMARYRITEDQISRGDTGGLWRAFILAQVERARKILQAGAPLGSILPGRVGLEMRMIILGGERILKKIFDTGGDVFAHRPVLQARDWAYMLWRAALRR